MGHASHFLQRLERVNELQVELALTLYRDEQLLKAVLDMAGLPDGAERLAVSLGDPGLGPFVVLTRSGRFVTCLGEGMRAENLHVVTRAQLDVAMGRVQRMRDEGDRIRQLLEAGGEGEVQRLARVLATSGPRFCREDAQRLDLVAPLIGPWIVEQTATMTKSVFELMPRMAAMRVSRLTPKARDVMLDYGRMVWALGNLLPMLAVRETRQLMKMVGTEQRAFTEYQLAGAAFELLTVAHGHRALWVMARSGKGGLSLLREAHFRERYGRRAFREMALAAIACGTPSLREEAVHRMSPGLTPEQAGSADCFVGLISGELQYDVLPCPDRAIAWHAEGGCSFLRKTLSSSSHRDAAQDAQDTDIPNDLAHAVVATRTNSWLGKELGECITLLNHAVPWLARATLPELYLPREWANRLIPELTLESIERWLTPCARLQGKARPATVRREAPKPERNATCACGSGKKRKRCCGMVGVSV